MLTVSLIIAGTYGFIKAEDKEMGVVFGIVCIVLAAVISVYEAPFVYQIINNLLFV